MTRLSKNFRGAAPDNVQHHDTAYLRIFVEPQHFQIFCQSNIVIVHGLVVKVQGSRYFVE